MLEFPLTPAEQLVLPGEHLAAFQQLRASLHAEHAAATPTELFLIEELVQNIWRIRRFRTMETANLGMPCPEIPSVALIQRALAAAERACHRALVALTKLQHARGFVPSKLEQTPELEAPATPKSGFVPQKLSQSIAEELGLDPLEFERLQLVREKIHARAANSVASFHENRRRLAPTEPEA